MPSFAEPAAAVAALWKTAFAAHDLAALEPLLDEKVRWGGAEDTPQTCHSRAEVLGGKSGSTTSTRSTPPANAMA